jgi:hypothetical protein
MNKAEKIIISGIVGTTFMTLFSYIVSELAHENFSEPEHLATMIKRLVPPIDKEKSLIAGWSVHYAIGFLFCLVYFELWRSGKIKPTVTNGVLLGTVSGLIAVIVWKLTFKSHPSPPWVDYTNYYRQLVPAHVIFAVLATVTYRYILTGSDELSVELSKPGTIIY